MKVTVGVIAYNEEQNIGKLLSKIPGLPVIVVASGCTDQTIPIAIKYGAHVIEQPKREGKASAINLFLKAADGDILVLCSADVLPTPFCFKYLLEPFNDPKVGVVGTHPIPINSLDTLTGRMVHLLWDTLHHMSLQQPKMSEMLAFRNVVLSIDYTTPVDEASLEYEIQKRGYSMKYAPDAIIFNKGPTSIQELRKQRSRIYRGHLHLRSQGYEIPTMSKLKVLQAAPKNDLVAFVYLCWIEYLSRREAQLTQSLPTIWEVCPTTKELT